MTSIAEDGPSLGHSCMMGFIPLARFLYRADVYSRFFYEVVCRPKRNMMCPNPVVSHSVVAVYQDACVVPELLSTNSRHQLIPESKHNDN